MITDPAVARSVVLNLLAYGMWAVFGLGLGTLIRNQTGAIVAAMAIYLAGTIAVAAIFQPIYSIYAHNWVISAAVVAPSIASPGDDHTRARVRARTTTMGRTCSHDRLHAAVRHARDSRDQAKGHRMTVSTRLLPVLSIYRVIG